MSDKRLMVYTREDRLCIEVIEHGQQLKKYDYDLAAWVTNENPEALLADIKKDYPDVGLDNINKFVRKMNRRSPQLVEHVNRMASAWALKAERLAARAERDKEEGQGP